MKITCNWLREYIDPACEWPEVLERLTMGGLECESVEDLGARYGGVVVGRVLARHSHPNADRLSVCRVELGGEERTIVCGAPNVAPGQKVAVVLPGHSLPGGTPIKKATIRGVESQGMICSAAELALGEEASGILVLGEEAQVGEPFAAQMGLDDMVVDFEVTPNRPDCLSVFGIAREVRALAGGALQMPLCTLDESGAPTASDLAVELQDPESCPRYVGRIIRGISVGPSPTWLQNRLRAVGQRPINNIVDLTNYVMLELGQPLHAFDLGKLAGGRILVRRARSGESLETLDGVERSLDEEILVIADAEKPVALAGIMGGGNSQVDECSADILLESAYFDPVRVRRARTRLDLHTEASMRFERGADWAMPPVAADRAARLIAQWAGGRVAPRAMDLFPRLPQAVRIRARPARIGQLLGVELDAASCRRSLELLGCRVEERGAALEVLAPSFRPDLEREVDLIEEVGRLYGYERLVASRRLAGPLGLGDPSRFALQARAWRRLSGLGFDEIASNTIVEERWLERVGSPAALKLANPPIEAQAALRTSLAPGLLEAAGRNLRHCSPRAASAALFELGKCFRARGEDGRREETLRLAALWGGRRAASAWQSEARVVDFLDLKGALETLLGELELRCAPAAHPVCRPGHCARVEAGGRDLGYLGQVRPALCAAFDLEEAMYIFELDFHALAELWAGYLPRFSPLPKFPPLERDLAVVLPARISAAAVAGEVRSLDPQLVEAVELFDLYQGDQIEEGHKSLAFSIRLRSVERTLEDAQASQFIERVLQRLKECFGATLR